MKGRVLAVAGSDSGGGAGIQADIKTVTALGGYAATAITALTAQDTNGVAGVFPVDPAFIRQQIEIVLDDIGADCLKTGMLHDAATIAAVADAFEAKAGSIPLVLDPVMIAKGGASLLEPSALGLLKRRLISRSFIVTPNVPEAAALAGFTVDSLDAMVEAAHFLRGLGAETVLVKGGHLPGDTVRDVFAGSSGTEVFEATRIETRHTHGTGCTLASAIATGIAQGMEIVPAILRAREYVRQAIATAPGFGRGHGPLNHATCWRMAITL